MNFKSPSGYSSWTDVVQNTLVGGIKGIAIKEFSPEQNERSNSTVCFSREAPIAVPIGSLLAVS